MGPILIFDKSALESLNLDEAMWLDNFFISNVTPLFFIETLADLEKEVRKGRTPEIVVGSLALKAPDASLSCNVHHMTLIAGELLGGQEVEMTHGRPIISGGEIKELDGKTGVIFRQSPEEEAFQRWQRKDFLDLERTLAKKWRQGLSNIDLEQNYQIFQRFFPIGKPKTLADVKKFVDFSIDGPDKEKVLHFGLSLVGITEPAQEQVLTRWHKSGEPSIREFCPYFTYVFSIDFFFNLAIAADLIGRGRPSHKIDLAYLYYLPFCMVFTSNDKLHASITPYFLRENQSFVLGTDLKADFTKLDAHYDTLPDEVKKRGVMSFASYPPMDNTFLVTRLWDKHMSPQWREHKTVPKPQPDSKLGKKISDEIRRFTEEGTPVSERTRVNSDEMHHMIIKRMVLGQKGKWKRFPPEVLNRRKNEKGEWEDIKPE